MGLYQFKTTPNSMVDKDLLNLRARIGGTIGQIRSGLDSLDVVKVADNVFVSARDPSKSLQALVNLDRKDIHVADHPAEIQLIKDRLRVLRGGV